MPFKRFRYLIIILFVLLLIGTVGVVYSISSETQVALKGSLQENLISSAGIAASGIDGDALAALRPGDENSPAFIRIRDQLRHVKDATPGIRYIYTMRKNGDAVEFAVDGDYGYSADAASVGERYTPVPSGLLAGFFGPSADTDFVTDAWGSTLSGYYPVRNSAGQIAGIVGVDMDSSNVRARLDRINLILYAVAICGLFLVGGAIILVDRRRSRNEQILQESEAKYRTLFESSSTAIFIMDRETFRDCNSGAERVYGRPRADIFGHTPADFSPERQPDGHLSRDLAREYIAKARAGKPQSFEWVHLRADRSPFTTEVTLSRIRLQDRCFVQAIVQDISERRNAEVALRTVTKKLSLLHAITFTEIRNAVFALSGYLTLERAASDSATVEKYRDLEEDLVKKITKSLTFAQSFQDLGASPPRWQNVNQSFVLAVSHLDFTRISRLVRLDNLEIYADPLLERVFYALADNILRHATGATRVTLWYERKGDGLVVFFEDDGCGIPPGIRELIFEWGLGKHRHGMDLFLAQEILSITGITLTETGEPGKGARFELHVPPGAFRFTGPEDGAGHPDGG